MSLLSAQKSADALGVSVLTLYNWLSQSDAGEFAIRGQLTSINYFQAGKNGQGRIKISPEEIERLLSLMKVTPKPTVVPKKKKMKTTLRHITTHLGRPED